MKERAPRATDDEELSFIGSKLDEGRGRSCGLRLSGKNVRIKIPPPRSEPKEGAIFTSGMILGLAMRKPAENDVDKRGVN